MHLLLCSYSLLIDNTQTWLNWQSWGYGYYPPSRKTVQILACVGGISYRIIVFKITRRKWGRGGGWCLLGGKAIQSIYYGTTRDGNGAWELEIPGHPTRCVIWNTGWLANNYYCQLLMMWDIPQAGWEEGKGYEISLRTSSLHRCVVWPLANDCGKPFDVYWLSVVAQSWP